ncbi:MAG: sensor histidine kinase [Caldilinea sp.]|nr:sensor histidine kinase [Caldilinea sp.]MCB0148771.1 sensor histidine kinase [Caldilineaceae bacterium]MCB9118050.1 sensor histidine kinase [Caldilineaceae bacterium]MCB9122869.1 sensor histidine kinase [Caldilineaceae bacterium]MCW5844259.1 sensor histidine kinase [Caldilinea sp.]
MIEQSWNNRESGPSSGAGAAPAPPRPDTGRWLRPVQAAWLMLVLTVAALWLWSVRIWASGDSYFGNSALDVPYGIVMPTGYFVVAVLLVVRKPNDPMAILTSLMLIFLGPYLLTGVNVTVSGQPGWEMASRLLLSVGGILFFLFLLMFPSGHFISRWMRWPALLLSGAYALGTLLSPEVYGSFSAAFIPATLLAGLGVQAYRYLRLSSPVQRQQTKWVVVGAVGPIIVVLYWLLFLEPGLYAPPADALLFYAHQSVLAALGLMLPVALAFSILRYRLWEIDLIINRTLVYGVLTAVIVALYAAVVGGMAALFQTQADWLVAFIATALAALLFQPLRDRLQSAVNRLLYGRRDEPFEVLAHLGQRLEGTLAPELVLPTIAETIAQTLKLPYVAIAMQQGDALQTAETYGRCTTTPQAFALSYQGAVIGQLLVATRAADEAFTAQEERLLQNIARQAGTAVHALQLTGDLQNARQQVVTSREEERRRLRRDLHDGLGPSLAAQLLKIGSARALLTSRPEMTERLLAEMETDTENILAEVRRIVYDLRPPALDQWGLVGALRAYAETCESCALAVQVEAPAELPSLPAAAEVAAYHIGREALTNVMRHAEASHCTLRLWVEGGESGRLHLTVRDDGRGLPARIRAGVGLSAMRERAAELGGSLRIAGAPSNGTQVTAVLPLGAGAETQANHVR